MAEQVRLTNPEAHIVVRQKNAANKAVLAGLRVDHVYIATELVAREVLARTLTPVFWRFAELAVAQDEAWAIALRDRLVERLGRRTPDRDLLTLSMADAPGLVHWLSRGMPFTLGDLVRDPGDRSAELPVVPSCWPAGTTFSSRPARTSPSGLTIRSSSSAAARASAASRRSSSTTTPWSMPLPAARFRQRGSGARSPPPAATVGRPPATEVPPRHGAPHEDAGSGSAYRPRRRGRLCTGPASPPSSPALTSSTTPVPCSGLC
ncbi:MAG: hypothetical protein IPH03_09955 [Tetrasphaera sp.]|nr:hypothetical protein [Tetrasphaera sp.]